MPCELPFSRLGSSLQPEGIVGLRHDLTQCFQEGVTEPWPPRDLEGEGRAVGAGAGGGKEEVGRAERSRETLDLCDTGFLALTSRRPQSGSCFWAAALRRPALWSCHLRPTGRLVIWGVIAVTTGNLNEFTVRVRF